MELNTPQISKDFKTFIILIFAGMCGLLVGGGGYVIAHYTNLNVLFGLYWANAWIFVLFSDKVKGIVKRNILERYLKPK